jgi:hypothetical protein
VPNRILEFVVLLALKISRFDEGCVPVQLQAAAATAPSAAAMVPCVVSVDRRWRLEVERRGAAAGQTPP